MLEQTQSLFVSLPVSEPMKARHATQEVVIGIKAIGGLALGALDLSLLQRGRNRAYHARGHSIL